jgi:hypothetical protein
MDAAVGARDRELRPVGAVLILTVGMILLGGVSALWLFLL